MEMRLHSLPEYACLSCIPYRKTANNRHETAGTIAHTAAATCREAPARTITFLALQVLKALLPLRHELQHVSEPIRL